MTRFVASTCGVLAEVAALDAAAPVPCIVLSVAGFGIAMVAWGASLLPLVDRIVGIDQ